MAQRLENLLAMQETGVRSLGREDPGKGNGNPLQCSRLENPHGQREPGGLQFVELQSQRWLNDYHTHTHTRIKNTHTSTKSVVYIKYVHICTVLGNITET